MSTEYYQLTAMFWDQVKEARKRKAILEIKEPSTGGKELGSPKQGRPGF